jgi:hypothetical protein
VNGKAAAIVQDVEAYQRLLDIAARADAEESIRQGIEDVAKGRTRPAKAVFDELAANMAYLVEFSAHAARDLEVLYVEKHVVELQSAARWYNGLEEAVHALGQLPHRCPPAPEALAAKATAAALALRKEASRLSGDP